MNFSRAQSARRDGPRPQFLSEADCHDVAERLARFSRGGGYSSVAIMSKWVGSLRWARNQVVAANDIRNNRMKVRRTINGATGSVMINDTTDVAIVAAARQAERLASQYPELPNDDLVARLPLEPVAAPSLFSDTTYQLDTDQRATIAVSLINQSHEAGVLSAGYIEVAAVGLGVLDSVGRVRYFPYTQARYSVTVRDPKGGGSGWAGVDWYDWKKIDAAALTARALEKCLQSRNPVAIEPGRYTTILEPQATADFVGPLVRGTALDRNSNVGDSMPPGPFTKSRSTVNEPGYSRIGEKIIDERITIGADPMDPELGFPPFWTDLRFSRIGNYDPFVMPVYHPATWITHGVLTSLAYPRFADYGAYPGRDKDLGLPNSGAFRMSGGATSVEEMITTTKRGLLVTRFDQIMEVNYTSQLYRGFTRDGLWLIENGKISKAVKNMTFTESILIALNNLEQLGPPQRVFHPNVAFLDYNPQPTVTPPIKVRDFSFTALADAV